MNKDILLQQYHVNVEQLLEYGFIKEKDSYQLKKELNEDLYAMIIIKSKSFQIDVYEKETGEKYLPFYLKDAVGSYVSDLKLKIEGIITDIIEHCLESVNLRDQILSYVKKKYGTVPEYSWEEYPNYFTLKTPKKQKWYGLVLDIPYQKLGLKGEEFVDVMNLKNTTERIEELINYKQFFPGYHMNKKYWITVLLDQNIDFELLKELIDESYQCVEPK